MIVIDTNIVAYLYLQTEFTHHAEGLLERDPQCAAPTLWRSEFRKILAGHMRRKVLPADDCEFVSLAINLGVKLFTMDSRILKAFPKVAVKLAAN